MARFRNRGTSLARRDCSRSRTCRTSRATRAGCCHTMSKDLSQRRGLSNECLFGIRFPSFHLLRRAVLVWRRDAASHQLENSSRVLTKKWPFRLLIEPDRIQSFERLSWGYHWVVGSEHHFSLSMPLHIAHKFWWISVGCIGRGIDVDILVLRGHGDHFFRPWVTDVAGYDYQLRKIQGHFVQIGDRAAGLRRPKRTGVSNLRTERDA